VVLPAPISPIRTILLVFGQSGGEFIRSSV